MNQALNDGPVDPHRDAVGRRRVRRWHLVLNPVFGQEVAELVGRVLAAVVGAKALDVLA